VATRQKRGKLISFEPSARIQGLLGRELISTDYVALAEAIRNSYDAGARKITLTLHPGFPQKLAILDNGSGMTLRDFEKLWMTPGYSAKASPEKKAGRATLGEKGIGRFAINRLSNNLVLSTKSESAQKVLRAEFDWTRFEDQEKKLKSIKIRAIDVVDEELIRQGHGTRLELSRLRREWNEKDWKGLRNEIKKLISPSAASKDFEIVANALGWESGPIKPDFDARGSYQYVFTVNKKGRITWSLTRPDGLIEQLSTEGHRIPSTVTGTTSVGNSFGFVSGRFYFFEKPAQIKNLGYEAGIGIYRDAFRVEPYGRTNDDWLGVKSLRAKRQGHAPVSPSKLFGFVEISRYENPKLRDLTNREGIQESKEFDQFREAMFQRFDHFAGFIAEDRSKMPVAPTIAGQRLSSTRQNRAQVFGNFADQLAHQLRQPMSHIATTVATLQRHVNKKYGNDERIELFTERILKNVTRLNSNIQGISDLATNLKTPVSDIDLLKMIDNLVTAHKPNFNQQDVRLTFKTDLAEAVVRFSKSALEFVLENFLNNALNATSNGNGKGERAVFVNLTKTRNYIFRISVEDNGGGVALHKERDLFNKPLASTTGSGNGLYFSKLRIEQFDGRIGYERLQDRTKFFVDIPGASE